MSRFLKSFRKKKPESEHIQAHSRKRLPDDSQIVESLATGLRLDDHDKPTLSEMGNEASKSETRGIGDCLEPHPAGGSRTEVTISGNQVTAKRDINMNVNSYNIGTGPSKEANQNFVHREEQRCVANKDKIAAGMSIPPVTSYIAERESQHNRVVDQLLTEPDIRVALLGMGGIGKTTLACSIARDPKVVDAYPRRLFVSFEGSSSPDLAFTSLANTFQIPATSRTSHNEVMSHVLEYLMSEKTLLIIDNFETFWEVPANRRDADHLLGQLASLSNLAIIVTMRGNQRPGNISWMKVDPLPTLSEDGSRGLLSVIMHGTHNTNASEEYTNNLLNAVAGIPLAVTLIGYLLRDESETAQSLWYRWSQESTRAISMDPDTDDRLYRLDVSLRLMVFGPRMKDTTREVLAAISLLPVGLSLEENWLDALQRMLASMVNIRDCIRTLRNVALAAPNPTDSPSGIHRLRLLPPVRDFCAHHLSLNTQVVRKVAELYHMKVRDIGDNFDKKEYHDWFTEEISNIAGMLKHSLSIGYVTDDLGYASLVYTRWLGFLGMPSTDIVECAVKALTENSTVKADCLRALGEVLYRLERTTEAIEKLEEALSIHRDSAPRSDLVAWDLLYLGEAHAFLLQYDLAERYLNEAVDIFTETPHEIGKSSALDTLCCVLFAQGKLSEAEGTALESLKLSRAVGSRLTEANALLALSQVYKQQGKFDLAVETLTTCCDVCKDINYVLGQAYANRRLAYVYWDTGELDKAALHLQETISLFEEANWRCFGELDKARADLEVVELLYLCSLASPDVILFTFGT